MEQYPVACEGFCCLQCVRQNEVGVVEDLGQFKRLLPPGLHLVCWPLQGIVGRVRASVCVCVRAAMLCFVSCRATKSTIRYYAATAGVRSAPGGAALLVLVDPSAAKGTGLEEFSSNATKERGIGTECSRT